MSLNYFNTVLSFLNLTFPRLYVLILPFVALLILRYVPLSSTCLFHENCKKEQFEKEIVDL